MEFKIKKKWIKNYDWASLELEKESEKDRKKKREKREVERREQEKKLQRESRQEKDQSLGSQSLESQLSESQSSESQFLENQSLESQSLNSESLDSEFLESQSSKSQSSESQSSENKSFESQSCESQSLESQSFDSQLTVSQTIKSQSYDEQKEQAKGGEAGDSKKSNKDENGEEEKKREGESDRSFSQNRFGQDDEVRSKDVGVEEVSKKDGERSSNGGSEVVKDGDDDVVVAESEAGSEMRESENQRSCREEQKEEKEEKEREEREGREGREKQEEWEGKSKDLGDEEKSWNETQRSGKKEKEGNASNDVGGKTDDELQSKPEGELQSEKSESSLQKLLEKVLNEINLDDLLKSVTVDVEESDEKDDEKESDEKEDEFYSYDGTIKRRSFFSKEFSAYDKHLLRSLMQIMELILMEEEALDESVKERWDVKRLLERRFTGEHLYECMHGEKLGKIYVGLDFSPSCEAYSKFYRKILKSCERLHLVKVFDVSNGFGLFKPLSWLSFWYEQSKLSEHLNFKKRFNVPEAVLGCVRKLKTGKGINKVEYKTLRTYLGSEADLTYCFTDEKYYSLDHFVKHLKDGNSILIFADFDGGRSYCWLTNFIKRKDKFIWFSSEERYDDLYEHSWNEGLSLKRNFKGLYVDGITKENALKRSVWVLRSLLKKNKNVLTISKCKNQKF